MQKYLNIKSRGAVLMVSWLFYFDLFIVPSALGRVAHWFDFHWSKTRADTVALNTAYITPRHVLMGDCERHPYKTNFVYLRGGQMKKFNIISLAFIIIIILIGNAFAQEPNKSSWLKRKGPKYYNRGGQIRFNVINWPIQNWRNYWSVSNSCSNYFTV